MTASFQELSLTTDHAVPVSPAGGTAIVTVQAGSTVFYSSSSNVSSSLNDGSIAALASQSFTNQTWLKSSGSSTVLLEIDSLSSAGNEASQIIATAASAQTLTVPASGKQTFDLTASVASCGISLAGAAPGITAVATVILRQDGVGGRAWTFPATVRWPNGQLPPFSTVANRYDVLTFLSTDGGATWTAALGASNAATVAVPSQPSMSAAPGSTQNVLSWSAPNPGGAPITGYVLQRSLTTGTETTYQTLAASATGYVDTGLTNSTTYFYKLIAQNVGGNSVASSEVSATPLVSLFNDSSSFSVPIVVVGAPTAVTKVASTITGSGWVNAVNLPSEATTQAALELPSTFAFGATTQPFTIECAFARTRTGVEEGLLAKWSGTGAASGSGNYFYLFVSSTNILSFAAWAPNNTQIGTLSGGAAITDTAWHWARVSYDGTTVYLFLDGTLVTSQGAHTTGLATPDTVTPVMVGGQNPTNKPFLGTIDEVRISNIARSTVTYVVPAAPFASDANTLALLHMD